MIANLDTRSVPSEYAKFLDKLEWTHFATFTTKLEVGYKAVERLAEKIAKKIPTKNSAGLKMFWVGEQFANGDGYHLHCLIFCPQSREANQLKMWYEATHGLCKVLSKKNGASSYVVKKLDHRLTEYGFF